VAPDLAPARASSGPAANSSAGGASQTDTSSASPGPTPCTDAALADNCCEKSVSSFNAPSRRATVSFTSISRTADDAGLAAAATCSRLGPDAATHFGGDAQPAMSNAASKAAVHRVMGRQVADIGVLARHAGTRGQSWQLWLVTAAAF
jgi:hypothetical protein